MAESKANTNEEECVKNILTWFCSFAYERSKQLIEREIELNKKENCKNSHSGWISLLNCMHQLTNIEKHYMNMAYLVSRGFLRLETSIRLIYETLLTDLAEIDRKQVPRPSSYRDVQLVPLITQLILFIQARLLMLTFYEKLANFPNNKSLCYDDLINHITEIMQKNSISFQLPAVKPLKNLFGFECDLILSLLKALKSMENWQFLESLIQLQEAHVVLQRWQAIVQSREAKKYRIGSGFSKSTSLPLLYQWFCTAKSAFVAKFSIYFYEPLLQQTQIGDMKSHLSKQTLDYVSKIHIFCRKTDVYSFNLVLDTNYLKGYAGKGYVHPLREIVPLQGIESFKSIFSYPQFPEGYWPSVVMRVSDINLDNNGGVSYFYDSKVDMTYFMCRIETRVTVVAMYESKKTEKDNVVKDFIKEIAIALRCSKVFLSLNPK